MTSPSPRTSRDQAAPPILDARGPDPRPALDPGIEVDLDGSHAVQWLAGDIDDANAAHVIELGSLAIAEPRVDELVIDLSRVTFMGSTGLGALIELHNQCAAAEKRFALRGVPAPVAKILAITELNSFFGLHPGDARPVLTTRPARHSEKNLDRKGAAVALSAITLKRALIGVQFPTDRETILAQLRRTGAPLEILDLIAQLPDRPFASGHDVSAAIANRSTPTRTS